MEPIKCDTKPKPNCEVKTKDWIPWEPRFEKDGVVYAYHQGYLWPQWPVEKYADFRKVVFLEDVWQEFKDHVEED